MTLFVTLSPFILSVKTKVPVVTRAPQKSFSVYVGFAIKWSR